MSAPLLSPDELAALVAKNEARRRRHQHCEQDDYGCMPFELSHYAADVCAEDIDLLLGHIAALEAAAPPFVTNDQRVSVRAERAGVVVEQVKCNRWRIGIDAGGQVVAICLRSQAPIECRIRTLSTSFAPALRLIPRVPIASLRFGQLVVNAVQHAAGGSNAALHQRLFYVSNDDLQRQVSEFLKEIM